MKLIPYDKFTVETNLSSEEVLKRIDENTESKKWSNQFYSKYFNGSVNKNGFSIQNNINSKNPIVPLLIGEVKPSGKGSRVNVTMRLKFSDFFVMFLWIAGVGFGLKTSISSTGFLSYSSLMSLAMLMFGISLPLFAFWIDGSRQKKYLIQLIRD
ncbi:hypothetical protein ACWJJH_03055 [Endozoicomonadaceae bacterium StTr2]